MPGQYVNYKYTRLAMVLMKCALSSFYLWLMLHAAAIMPELIERWESTFWTSRVKLFIRYRTVFISYKKSELIIYMLVTWVMFCLFRCCRCNFLGSRCISRSKDIPNLDCGTYLSMSPYLMAFAFLWMLSVWRTVVRYSQVIDYTKENNAYLLLCQFFMALAFKLLVLTNFYSTFLRVWMILNVFEKESEENEVVINTHDFGEHLNLFFRV